MNRIVWTIVQRGIGLVYFIVFYSLRDQVAGLGGSRGIYPVHLLLARIRRDIDAIETRPQVANNNTRERDQAHASEAKQTPRGTWRSLARRIAWFPTYCWLAPDSDALLDALPTIGLVCASMVFLGGVGGVFGFLASFGCWSVFLSLATVLSEFLVYPWDCLLLESGFLALFLPTGPSLFTSIGSFFDDDDGGVDSALSDRFVVPPQPQIIWCFWWLIFRVMFGMGHKKFFGSKSLNLTPKSDSHDEPSTIVPSSNNRYDYIRWFMLWQPLPTPFGKVLFEHLPLLGHQVALFLMFLCECILPFFIFLPETSFLCYINGSEWRRIFGVSIMVLQIGIGSSGNFGCFNILTTILAFTLFDQTIGQDKSDETIGTTATMMREFGIFNFLYLPFGWLSMVWTDVLSYTFTSPTLVLLDLLTLFLFLGGLIYLPFDSYFTNTWLFTLLPSTQRPWSYLPNFITQLFRFGTPFHILHAYGVFGVETPQHDAKIIIIRATKDGLHWSQFTYRYLASQVSQPLRVIAPFQSRCDHQLYYEGLRQRTCYYNYLNPYYLSRYNFLDRLVQRLFEQDPSIMKLFEPNLNFSKVSPPKMISVQRYSFVYREEYQRQANVHEEHLRRTNPTWSTLSSQEQRTAIDAAVLAHRRSFELELLEPRGRPTLPSPHPHVDRHVEEPAGASPTWHRLFIEHLPPQSSITKQHHIDEGRYSKEEVAQYHVPDSSPFILPEPKQFMWTHYVWRNRFGVD